MENMLVGAGIVFMAGALIGGGLSAFGVTLPLLASIKRQVLLFVLGAVLLAVGINPGLIKRSAETGSTLAQTSSQAGAQTNLQVPAQSKSLVGAQTNSQGADISNSQAASQTNAASTPQPPVMGPLETGVNRQGYDFDDIGVEAANAPICAELCRVNDRCVAMTYVISLRRCWLKSKVPAPTPNPDMISAVKDKG